MKYNINSKLVLSAAIVIAAILVSASIHYKETAMEQHRYEATASSHGVYVFDHHLGTVRLCRMPLTNERESLIAQNETNEFAKLKPVCTGWRHTGIGFYSSAFE